MDNYCEYVKGHCTSPASNEGWYIESPHSPFDIVQNAGTYGAIVYLALCDLAKGQRRLEVSIGTIAELARVSESTVRRARQDLVKHGYIQVIHRAGYADLTVLEGVE